MCMCVCGVCVHYTTTISPRDSLLTSVDADSSIFVVHDLVVR